RRRLHALRARVVREPRAASTRRPRRPRRAGGGRAAPARGASRLGARVVRVEPAEGEPLRLAAPAWHAALDAGKESVVCDLNADAGLELANALCDRARVVLDGFRPGVLERLGVRVPEQAVLCAITGFGADGRHAGRAGH